MLCSQGNSKQLKVFGHKGIIVVFNNHAVCTSLTVHVYICLKCNIGTDLRIVKQSPGVVERTSFTAPCALYCCTSTYS